jgi:choline dehydrogenase-like flavoprotein
MHIDLDQGGPASLEADVAVIGAGAAGLTMARRLLAGGLSVILLESGGLDYEDDAARLNQGDNVGRPYYRLDHARLRFFGGTTAIWGGRCAELDPIDFEARPWVPHSGWPLSHQDLAPYYAQAWAAFDLPPPAALGAQERAGLPPFGADELATPHWLFDEHADRFSFGRSRDLIKHPRARVVTHATVREIVARPGEAAVDHLNVVSMRGHRLHVRARTYVLAAGGIENPRILLASRSARAAGIGNDNDLVGRFFMEHPHARGGRIVRGRAWRLLASFQKRSANGVGHAPLLTPSPELQRREGLLNTSLTIAGRRPPHMKQPLLMRAYLHAKENADPTRAGRTLWQGLKRTIGAAQRAVDPLRPWLLHKAGQLDVALVVRGEQAPNFDSRVRLSQDKDMLGMPRVALDWRTSSIDVRSTAGLVAALGRECRRLGLGEVEPADWLRDGKTEWVTDALISTHPIGGYHHIGTTRMSHDPRTGVTDAMGRVHDTPNLYVAGSSLFPTSGWANPTLTIVALAMRTADSLLAKAA